MTIIGVPGQYARGLARTARIKQAMLWVSAVALVGGVYWAQAALGALAVAVAVGVGLWLGGQQFQQVAARAAVGYRSERDTVRALRKGGFDGTVFCGLLLGGGGDADLVVVDRAARVFVGEVKTVRGVVTVRGNQMMSNGQVLSSSPAEQVRRQQAALSRRGIHATPFIVASHGRDVQARLAVAGVPIVTAASLPQFLSHAQAPRSAAAVKVLRELARQQELRGA